MRELIIIFTPLIVSVILIPIIILLSKKMKILDHPGERKVHSESKPHLGGIGIAAGFFVGILLPVGLNREN